MPLLIIVIFYVGGPLLIWKTHKFHIEPDLDEMDLDEVPLEDARRYVARSADALSKDNFVASRPLSVPGPTSHIFSVAVLLEHQTTQDLALVAATMNNPAEGATQLKASFTEFATFFPNGASILTNNSPLPRAFESDTRNDLLRCPGIVSLAVLYKVHRARVERSPLNKQPRLLPADGDEAAFVGKMISRQFESQVEKGIMEKRDGFFRPTLGGAFKMVWAALPPMKQIRKVKDSNQTAAKLRELGFDTAGAFE